jgi:hypothetical protein
LSANAFNRIHEFAFPLNQGNFPPESRFRWTCEVLLPVADFLAQATPAEMRGFDRAVANGPVQSAWINYD